MNRGFVIARDYGVRWYKTRRGGWEQEVQLAYVYPDLAHAAKAVNRMGEDTHFLDIWIQQVTIKGETVCLP